MTSPDGKRRRKIKDRRLDRRIKYYTDEDRRKGAIENRKRCWERIKNDPVLFKEFQEKNRERVRNRDLNVPWEKHYRGAQKRCNNSRCGLYQFYGAKGIKQLMSVSDFKMLWFRDKAHLMSRPSIDRINPKGNYEVNNCRFIELSENCRRSVLVNRAVRVARINKDGTRTIFDSIADAGRAHGYFGKSCGSVWGVIRGKQKSAYGHKWELA